MPQCLAWCTAVRIQYDLRYNVSMSELVERKTYLLFFSHLNLNDAEGNCSKFLETAFDNPNFLSQIDLITSHDGNKVKNAVFPKLLGKVKYTALPRYIFFGIYNFQALFNGLITEQKKNCMFDFCPVVKKYCKEKKNLCLFYFIYSDICYNLSIKLEAVKIKLFVIINIFIP